MLKIITLNKLRFSFIVSVLASSITAQSTVLKPGSMEKTPMPKKESLKIWNFETSFGASVYTGDEEFSLVNLDIKASGKYPAHTISIQPSAEYRQSDDTKQRKVSLGIVDTIALHKISNISDRWGSFVDLKYQKDDSAGIEQRNDSLLGIGYNFFGAYRSDEKGLILNTAFGYRDQRNTDNSKTNYSFSRTSLQWQKKISTALNFSLEVTHTANLDKFEEDYEDKLIGSLENIISKATSLIIKQESNYDNTPVTGKKKNNSISKVELKYKF